MKKINKKINSFKGLIIKNKKINQIRSLQDLAWLNLKKDLKNADLRWANLDFAYLRWADLWWADLRGASLRWANLEYINVNWAKVDIDTLQVLMYQYSPDWFIWDKCINRCRTQNEYAALSSFFSKNQFIKINWWIKEEIEQEQEQKMEKTSAPKKRQKNIIN